MSNLSSGNSESGEEAYETSIVLSSSTRTSSDGSTHHQPKKTRRLPGNPDPSAEVIALSPRSLMAKNRFICEVCNKGFQREQNLQLHRRGHNLPWKLKQKAAGSDVNKKRVYICPEASCIHHNPNRALGDLTGIKKHYSRKHGEKKWKCDKCSKKYAVQSDWKAHSKTCGTKDYRCDCGTIFSRRDSFVTHRAFCDALAEENNKANQLGLGSSMSPSMFSTSPRNSFDVAINMSATTLLQQAAQMGAIINSPLNNSLFNGMQVPIQSDHIMHGFGGSDQTSRMQNDGWYNGLFNESQNITKEGHNSLTLDFLGNGANEFSATAARDHEV